MCGCRWILQNLGDDLTEADIDDMIADVDTDGSGWVDYNGQFMNTNCDAYRIIGRYRLIGPILHNN